MSTLSGNASKGEKSKPKFQSLDINSLYKISRGENTEKPAQKNSSNYIKHGMQSLGKVPNARRAPANLPSLKSEHSDSGAAVPLVPPGATGWGKQQEQGSSQPTTNAPQNGVPPNQNATPAVQGPPPLTPHQQAIAIPSTNVIPPHTKQPTVSVPIAGTSGGDKLWSAVMAGGQPDGGHPPAYQSPQFQHEFPSLSAGDGVAGVGPRAPSDYTAAGPGGGNQSGLSLRPQTEGSWTQGGQRAPDGSVKSGSAALAAPPQLAAQGGRAPEMLPPQMRGVLPPFMYKGSFPQGAPQGGAVNHSQSQMGSAPHNGRRSNDGRPPRLQEVSSDELAPRPIIREEELSKLDEFGHDMGWATSDDIDYNQKLAFSDDEDRPSKNEFRQYAGAQPPQSQQQLQQSVPIQGKSQDVRAERQSPPKHWNMSRSENYRGRQTEDDEVVAQKHRHNKEVDLAIQRAKQRKEEEEKRFIEENRQRAQKKLQELNEKAREKRDRDRESEVGTISPSAVPPKPINHVDIPLPEFQKEREKDQRPRVLNEGIPKEESSGFRQISHSDPKGFSRKPQQKSERDHREQNGPSFSRHFQNDLPPRFLKHQQRNTSTSQSQPQGSYSQYESNRWPANARAPSRSGRPESPDRHDEEHRDYKRQSSDESYRSSHHSQADNNSQKSTDIRYGEEPYSKRDDDKWQKEKTDSHFERKVEVHERERYYEGRRSQETLSDRFDRPQRPDSRDSHTSHTSHTSHGSQGSNRRSRDSELKESMGSWTEDVEAAYEEKKEKEEKEIAKEEKRSVPTFVPGPITRDRIEADDVNEKRNLTQLKKGEMPPPKKVEVSKKDDSTPSTGKQAWGEIISMEEAELKKEQNVKVAELKKPQSHDDYKDRQSRSNRSFSQTKSWGSSSSSSDFHTRGSSWGTKQRPPSRGLKTGGRDFYSHDMDSDGSTDTYSVDSKESKSMAKKSFDKDDKNSENKQEKLASDQRRAQNQEKGDHRDGSFYVPRGEPSRHGRGAGNNFRGNRMGGSSKRVNGYGPPPSKSPFSHHDEKEKKATTEENINDSANTSTQPPPVDKIKQNQEALAAGIMGKPRQESLEERNKPKFKTDNRRNKSKTRRDEQDKEMSGEFLDNSKRQPVSRSSSQRGGQAGDRRIGNDRRERTNPPRSGTDKRGGSFDLTAAKRPEGKSEPQNLLASAIADISLKNREEDAKDQKDINTELNGDSDGFQEVKSKKTTKERPKGGEEKKGPGPRVENKDSRQDKKQAHIGKPLSVQHMTPQQIQNIPPLMSTPVNPVNINMLPPTKNQYDQRTNNRQNKLAPRFAKQKMQQQMQQQMMSDIGDINKMPQASHYGIRDKPQSVPPVPCSAWDKPLGSQLRPADLEAATNMLGVAMDGVNLEGASSPVSEKIMGKPSQISDKNLLDGTTPPVNTIIFENTNFKSAPGVRNASRSVSGGSNDKQRPKMDDNMDNNVFAKPINDLLQKNADNATKQDSIQIAVFKEESDIKLDFFGADLTHLTEDKSTKNLCMSKNITAVNNTICNADSLNMKIASVKKVWDTTEQETEDTSGMSFGAPLDAAFKGSDAQDDGHHEGFSPGNSQAASTTNVCKVKPTQQVASAPGQIVSSASQQHSAMVGHAMLMGTPLSPPPMAATAVGVSLGPQPFATNQHLTGFPTASPAQGVASAGSAQYGISTIPSPPTVLYNSTQQLQSAMYTAFMPTADQASVLGSQGHARTGGFGQYPAAGAYHNLGQPTNSPYNTQSVRNWKNLDLVYVPTAPHPPPTAQAPPELYSSLNSFRLSAAPPFGQNQGLNNPTTVLISSTSNSLMSPSVKPSQPISAIGTKAGGVGQAYQQQSQQGQQVYMTYEPSLQAANYLQGAGVMQRGPTGPPVQNSVVPGLQPSSSYYSGSTGFFQGGQTGYYQQPGNSSLPSAPQLSQHQAGYGLQGNVFGTHNQTHANTGLQGSYPFHHSTPMQVAAALNVQQFRSAAAASMQNPYMKNVGGGGQSISGDPQVQQTSGGQRPQPMKSPSSQEVLSSVFGSVLFISAPQIPSPKLRQNNKHLPQQSSPTTQRKYNFYQGVGSQQNNLQQRYPTPIQRPVNVQQQNMNSVHNNGSNNQKHNRNNSNKAPNRQYYGGQSGTLATNQTDKPEDKVQDNSSTKTTTGTNISKDVIKEDTSVLKE
uniref:BAT2 N-terminal domain-containing protein n=1 Tax=Dendroctonus ponderosae TaxID=77166 RepID=A0AAR5Q3P1_DENPD